MIDELQSPHRPLQRAAHQSLIDFHAIAGHTVHAQKRAVTGAQIILRDADPCLLEFRYTRIAPGDIERLLALKHLQGQYAGGQFLARKRFEDAIPIGVLREAVRAAG